MADKNLSTAKTQHRLVMMLRLDRYQETNFPNKQVLRKVVGLGFN